MHPRKQNAKAKEAAAATEQGSQEEEAGSQDSCDTARRVAQPEHGSKNQSHPVGEDGYISETPSRGGRLPAYLKGKRRAGPSNTVENDDGDVEVRVQILDSFKTENQALFAEFMRWKMAHKAERESKPPAANIERSPSVKIKEVVDEEATPFQREQVIARQQSAGASEIVSSVMADRIARLTDNETIGSLSPRRLHKERQPFDYVDPKSNIGRALNESVGREGTPSQNFKMKIKPIRPEKYNGEVSARKFIRFVKAVRRYMIDRNVPPERQVDIMTNDLEGIAYNFVERLCGDAPKMCTSGTHLV
ncbi:hypothetical protein V5O48_018325 [Marasmius crinis-equi]|uniref:Uncharacterized protein n=1 Tax=Marasmius crinis-equi TaxID=585013 RepID=A0ABR3ELM7_9AGAR